MSKISKQKAIKLLWERGELSYKLKGKQKDVYSALKDDPNDVSVILISRRFGKCIAEGTKIPTTKGLKNIEDIEVGDYVYGYDESGNVTPTRVEQKHDQGIKDVVDLVHSRKVYATVTEDHRFLTYNPATGIESVKRVADMYGHEKIRREFIEASCGEVDEPQAYAVGALLGDGCSKQGNKSIHISGNDEEIILKVKKQLNAQHHYKQNINNYTWVISDNEKLKRRGYAGFREPRPFCNLYEEWCSDRYAHEKIADINIIKKWNRRSCLDYLAGLIDTDGSVGVTSNNLQISFHSQSISILESVKFLFQQLFFVDVTIYEDKRDKYVNGNVFFIQLKNNLHCQRILKELDPYIQVPRKKWKNEYSLLKINNSNEKFIGIEKQNPRKVKCWDIGINNGTHLYLMENGLVTHNSFLLCLLACEICETIPNAIVKYACPQQRMVKTIIKPIMREILNDCPDELKPEWKEQDKIYAFPNGSEIQIAGTDNGNAENLRGGAAHACIIDEAGFCDDLDYIVNSILLPTTDTTGGRLIMASTPNFKDPQHQFHESFVFPMEAENRLVKYTIEDSPMVNEATKQRIRDRYIGGETNPKYRCEYLCEIPRSSELTVIPEFNVDTKKELIVEEYSTPDFFDPYVSMDVGFRDLTVALFGYYDFRNAQLVIIDELVMNGPEMTTDHLARELKKTEEIRFYNDTTNEMIPAYLRVMDNDLKLINDLYRLHGLHFIATQKDNKEAAINNVRMWVANGRIKIHNRCKHLIYHMENAQWDKTRSKFKQLKDSPSGNVRGGHADALDALIYMIRNIMESRNPFPNNYGKLQGSSVFEGRNNNETSSEIVQTFKKMFNIKK